MRTVNWVVPDYHCHHCLSRITDALRDIKGVRLLRSDPTKHTLTVEGYNWPQKLDHELRWIRV
jgi:copper chaperone CopZ